MLIVSLLAYALLPSLVLSVPSSYRLRRRSQCPNRTLPTPASSGPTNAPSTTPTDANSPSATSSPDTPPPVEDADTLDGLFPLGQTEASWSTSPDAKNSIPLTDAALGAFKVDKTLPHPVVDAPGGQKAMQVHFPKGEWGLGNDPTGGVSFYANGSASVDLTTAKEAVLGYRLYFDEGFEFNKGGKLPGLYGGDTPDGSVSCSGGRISAACFSTRYMWRTDGAGEVYAYLPPHSEPEFAANDVICHVKPESVCNDAYGSSIGRGAYHFSTGQWNTLAQRVRLNDPGQANGQIEAFFNGQSVIKVDGVIIRQGDAGRIRGLQVQSFFGGSDSSWASPRNQNVYFRDFSVAITETL